MTDWQAITRHNARSVQTTVGWVFWDPGAVVRYRGTTPDDIETGWAAPARKGLARGAR